MPATTNPATASASMNRRTRRTIGVANALEGTLALAVLVAAYGLAEQLVADQEAAGPDNIAARTAHWVGPDFPVTLSMSLILVGAAAGFVGSVIQQSIVFAQRAGLNTLQQGFVWWYVLRPVWSALLGAIVVIAANAGLVSIGDQTTSTAGVTVLVNLGCLAGLFTDQVLQRLQGVLGAEDHHTLLGHDNASGPGEVAPSGVA